MNSFFQMSERAKPAFSKYPYFSSYCAYLTINEPLITMREELKNHKTLICFKWQQNFCGNRKEAGMRQVETRVNKWDNDRLVS